MMDIGIVVGGEIVLTTVFSFTKKVCEEMVRGQELKIRSCHCGSFFFVLTKLLVQKNVLRQFLLPSLKK